MAGVRRTPGLLGPRRSLDAAALGMRTFLLHAHVRECLHHSRTHMSAGQPRSHRCILRVHVNTHTHARMCTYRLSTCAGCHELQPDRGLLCHTGEEALSGKEAQGSEEYLEGEWMVPYLSLEEGVRGTC